jgi:hypothetical protein
LANSAGAGRSALDTCVYPGFATAVDRFILPLG